MLHRQATAFGLAYFYNSCYRGRLEGRSQNLWGFPYKCCGKGQDPEASTGLPKIAQTLGHCARLGSQYRHSLATLEFSTMGMS